ncbi:replication factor C subunit 2 [Chlorella sorokiniana]|uniref:Replication factor C subunit 2 n=1 Tax=Chlorella sorokiniana TaxID=3076 RepID=A0A2P6TQ27_CHLSO|nr:replication factor C subunit 2 [Chlorella sorokiniana]|eukprot:PRW56135.1 replication factor C subunit 2 [Chlorella sorokiniana]
MAQPWTEKYRPRTISDVAHQEEVVATLQHALSSGNLPHLLFYGPPGTGKTTAALAIVRQLFGPELCKTRVLELNASDERGIAVVRDKIKNFAQNAVGNAVPGYPCPPFKVIILDEADAMTGDAQNALRRTMETHSKVTRFVFICNYVSRIIEPLASRCAKFRFKPLQGAVINDRIQHICAAEGVMLGEGALEALSQVSGGDMRKTITTLQSAVRLRGSPVEPGTIMDVAGAVPASAVQGLLEAARSGKFSSIQQAVTDLIADGYPAQEILLQLQAVLLQDGQAPDSAKGKILGALAEADKNLVDGSDEFLQLLGAASYAQRVPRKAVERVGGTAIGGVLGLLAARASQQVAGLWPFAPSLVLSLAAALMALATARLCLAEGMTASLRLSIISFISTAFSAEAMAGSEALHALVQTAGVAIAVVLNVSAAIFILPQTGTMRGARSSATSGRRALGYQPIPSESDVEACLARATADGVESLLTDINAALLSVTSTEPIAQQELFVGRLVGGRHLFLPRVHLLLGAQQPKPCLPWAQMKAFVLSIRSTARRLAAIAELLANDAQPGSQLHLNALLEQHTTGVLGSLTVVLNSLDDPAALHMAASHIDQLTAVLDGAKPEEGDPLLLYLAQRVAHDLSALVAAATALVEGTPRW